MRKCYLLAVKQTVNLSADLVLAARLIGQAVRRSIAGQIEYWANMGRAVEPLLQGAGALGLARSGQARPLSTCLTTVDAAEGRRRLKQYLASQPFPHYAPVAEQPGFLTRIEASGKRTVGRFVNRKFQTVRTARAK